MLSRAPNTKYQRNEARRPRVGYAAKPLARRSPVPAECSGNTRGGGAPGWLTRGGTMRQSRSSPAAKLPSRRAPKPTERLKELGNYFSSSLVTFSTCRRQTKPLRTDYEIKLNLSL